MDNDFSLGTIVAAVLTFIRIRTCNYVEYYLYAKKQ